MTRDHYEPTSVELGHAIQKIFDQKQGLSLNVKEVYVTLQERQEGWLITERRVAKFVKRFQNGATDYCECNQQLEEEGEKECHANTKIETIPLTPTTSLDLTPSAGVGTMPERSQPQKEQPEPKAGSYLVQNRASSPSTVPKKTVRMCSQCSSPNQQKNSSSLRKSQWKDQTRFQSNNPSRNSNKSKNGEDGSSVSFIRGLLRNSRNKLRSNISLPSSTSSRDSSLGSMRSSLTMLLRRRRMINASIKNTTTKNNSIDQIESDIHSAVSAGRREEGGSLTLRSRLQRSLMPSSFKRNHEQQSATILQDFPLGEAVGGVPPSQIFEPVSPVSVEEASAIQAAIQAVLRQEESRQKHIDTMDQLVEGDDEGAAEENDSGGGDKNIHHYFPPPTRYQQYCDDDGVVVADMNEILATTAYFDENDFHHQRDDTNRQREECCCWNN